jgi:hypothetical protein
MSLELTYRKIARRLRRPIRTVANHYMAMFQLIVGQPYLPETWLKVFGPLKLSKVLNPVAKPRVSTRRPLKSKSRRPVPETTLGRKEKGSGPVTILESAVSRSVDPRLLNLLIDFRALASQGLTDGEIEAKLELNPATAPRVRDYLRERMEEPRSE